MKQAARVKRQRSFFASSSLASNSLAPPSMESDFVWLGSWLVKIILADEMTLMGELVTKATRSAQQKAREVMFWVSWWQS